ncbi:MAG: HK97 gp10 family phage protein, partial [Dermatophilaceae bacterium]
MRFEFTVNIDDAAMRSFLEGQVAGAVAKAASTVRDDAKAIITSEGRVDNGTMRNATISETARVDGNRVVARVATQTGYAKYQHDGTANNGAGFIYPRRARVLRFPSRSGGFTFAPKVRGVKGIRFL